MRGDDRIQGGVPGNIGGDGDVLDQVGDGVAFLGNCVGVHRDQRSLELLRQHRISARHPESSPVSMSPARCAARTMMETRFVEKSPFR